MEKEKVEKICKNFWKVYKEKKKRLKKSRIFGPYKKFLYRLEEEVRKLQGLKSPSIGISKKLLKLFRKFLLTSL